MAKTEWQQLELLVAGIQQELGPHAEVVHNAKVAKYCHPGKMIRFSINYFGIAPNPLTE